MGNSTSKIATIVVGLSLPTTSILFAGARDRQPTMPPSSSRPAPAGPAKGPATAPTLLTGATGPAPVAADTVADVALAAVDAEAKTSATFTRDSLEKTVVKVARKPAQRKFLASELEKKIAIEIHSGIIALVKSTENLENTYFQTAVKNLRVAIKEHYVAGLKEYGQADRSDDEIEINFVRAWKEAINTVFLEEVPKSAETPEKQRKTTILNLMLRQSNALQIEQKVQTLIENGADRNLNREFFTSPRMNNQSEYPLRIALTEISDRETRFALLKVLIDDNVRFQYQSALSREDGCEPLEFAIVSLKTEGNARYVLTQLIEQNDFQTFNIILNYVEAHNIFITEEFTDRSSQIEDQIKCDILENILKKMRDVRQHAISTAKDGRRYDNIDEFFSSDIIAADMASSNDDNRFDEGFRERLTSDFQPQFDAIAQQIDAYHKISEIKGSEFQGLVIEWSGWAHFRNRVASHLNKFAMAATNKAEKSNVIKLIRYAKTYTGGEIHGELDEIFAELFAVRGRDIIFNKTNRMGWTPLMYAMFQKQSDGFQMLVHQVVPDISLSDGVDNNILHLAFPLPEEFFKAESGQRNSNVLEYVGVDSDDKDINKKTGDAIKAILTEKKIPIEQKVKALTQMSSSNYTPVSLAAALGMHEIYEYLVDFLKAAGAWNRDDHEHLADPLEKTYGDGLKRYLERSRERLTAAEVEVLSKKVAVNDEEMTRLRVLSEKFHIYSSDDFTTKGNLEKILAPAEGLLNNFDSSKRNVRAPFEPALNAAIKTMLYPPMIERTITKEITETTYVDAPAPAPEVKKSKGFFASLFSGDTKKVPVTPTPKKPVVTKRQVTETIREVSPLDGLRYANSVIKSSYLAEVVGVVVDKYLSYATGSRRISFDDAYRAITENDTKSYFKKSFNETVERRMQKVIRERLIAGDCLKEDEPTVTRRANRFDGLARGQIKDDFRDFAGEDQDENDKNEEEVL